MPRRRRRCCCSAWSRSLPTSTRGYAAAATCSAASGRRGRWRSPSPPPARSPTRPSLGRLHAPHLAQALRRPHACSPPPAIGVFGGLLATTLFGAFTALCAHAPRRLLRGRPRRAPRPRWYVLPILVIGLAGGVGQGVLNLYASGLDLEALIPRAQARAHDADHQCARDRARLPRHVRARRGRLDHRDDAGAERRRRRRGSSVNLARLPRRAPRARTTRTTCRCSTKAGRGGRYWFTGGWNLRAMAAWAAGSAFGLLAVDHRRSTPARSANLAGGVDISLAGSALVAAAVYLVALAVWPEGEPVMIDPLTRWAAVRREARLRRPADLRRPPLHRGPGRAAPASDVAIVGAPMDELDVRLARARASGRGRSAPRRCAAGPHLEAGVDALRDVAARRRLRRRADPPRRSGALARRRSRTRWRRCSRRARSR